MKFQSSLSHLKHRGNSLSIDLTALFLVGDAIGWCLIMGVQLPLPPPPAELPVASCSQPLSGTKYVVVSGSDPTRPPKGDPLPPPPGRGRRWSPAAPSVSANSGLYLEFKRRIIQMYSILRVSEIYSYTGIIILQWAYSMKREVIYW